MIDPVVARMLRLALASLFLAAAGHKLADLARFRAALAAYRIVPGSLAPLIVGAEIGTAVLLLAGLPLGAVAGAGLFALYAGAIGLNLARGRRAIDCGCVGAAGRQGIGWELVARNAILAAAAGATLIPVAARTVTWVDVLTVGGGVLGLAALYAAADGLLANLDAYRRLREAT